MRNFSLLLVASSLLFFNATFAQGPSNDNCANALPITVGASCTFATYNNVSTTAEPTSVAPNPTCGFYNGGDVWFTFVMPASGHLRIERATLGGADAQLALYSGTCGSFTQLACLQSTANNASININQPSFAGQTIYIRAFGFNSAAGGSFNLCLWEAPIQPNDNCANATPITVGASCSMQSGSNLFATAEPTSVAINPTCGFYSGGDVWYTFTMPASGGLRLEYSRISGIATSFAFYTGNCGSFTEFSCLQNTGNTAAINISRTDLAGQTIYLRAYGFSSNQGGEYNFCVWEAPVQPNDNCANATPITVGASCSMQSGSNLFATAEPTSVAINPTCGFYSGGDVWYTFTMPASGGLRLEYSRISGIATCFAFYTGTCGSFTEFSCLQNTGNTAAINISRPDLAGQTIYLRAFGYGSNQGGTYNFCLWEAPIPANDNCANATTLPVTPSCVLQETDYRYATAEPTSVATNPSCGFYNGGDVWFTLTMPNSGQLQINRQHISGAQAQLALYSGTCGSFTQLSCLQTPAGTNNTLTFNDPALIGQTLYLRVFGYSSNQGGQFRLCAFNPAAIEWTGAADSLWSNPANWQGGMVPQAADNVYVPQGTPHHPVLDGNATISKLTMDWGPALIDIKDYNLTVLDDVDGSGTIAANFGRLILTGKTSKTNLSGFKVANVEFNNPYGFQLVNGDLEVTYLAYLTSGIVETDNGKMLNLNDALIAGGKSSAFISGPLRLSEGSGTSTILTEATTNPTIQGYLGNANALFEALVLGHMTFDEMDGHLKEAPTGKIGGRYAPVRLEKLDSIPTTFVVEYFDGNFGNNNVGSGLDRMSQQEYWKIDRVAGLGKANVEISFRDGDFSGIAAMDTADFVMARFGGTNWQIANGPRRIRGNATVGAVGAENLNEFGFFTFGSINGINPLAPLLPFIWSGDVSQLWGFPGNWQNNQVPPPGKKVTIPLTTNQPVLDQNRIIETLVIDNNATIQLGDYNLTIQGDIQGRGEILSTDWGRVIISGKNSKAQLDGVKVSNIEFNNFRGFELSDGDLEVQKLAYLTSGIVETDNGKMLNLNDALIAGGKSSAFISGPLRLSEGSGTSTILTEATTNPTIQGYLGNANALFEALVLGHMTFDEMDGHLKEAPTGKIGGRYAPVRLEKLDSIPTTFVVEYFDGNFGNNNVGSGLDRMSQQEYWKIDRVAGLGKANIDLSYRDGDYSGIALVDTADLVVVRFGGTNWVRPAGKKRVSGNATIGRVGVENQNQFGFFTFGSINGINPLATMLPFVWTGSIDTMWNNPNNWKNNQVPMPGKRVTIADTALNKFVLDQTRTTETVIYPATWRGSLDNVGNHSLIVLGDIRGKGAITSDGGGHVVMKEKEGAAELGGQIIDRLTFDNPKGFVVTDTVVVRSELDFKNGLVTPQNGAPFIVNTGFTLVDASPQSHVNGPVLRYSESSGTSTIKSLFVTDKIPTGKDGRYGPCGIQKSEDSVTIFSAEYFTGPYVNTTTDGSLSHISSVEYWAINRLSGSNPAAITLYFEDGNHSGILTIDTAELAVAWFNGTTWQLLPGDRVSTGNVNKGSITIHEVTDFGLFTFGSKNGINPLVSVPTYSWEGAVSTQWSDPLNWADSTLPVAPANVRIRSGRPRYPEMDVDVQLRELRVDAGASLNIPIGQNLTVQGLLTNSGTITVQGGGALVQTTGSTLAGSGTFSVRRTIPAHNGFRFIGSPINNRSVNGFGITPTGTNGAQLQPIAGNCNPDSISPTSPFGNIQELRESATLIDNCSHSLWHVKSSGILTNGRGYSMNTTAGQTLNFTGTVNNDDVSYSGLTRTVGTVGLPGGGTSTRGWHLLANPYPSPVQLTAADLIGMGFDAQIHFWQPTGNFTGNWVAVDPLTTANIAVGQGFQVRKTTEGGTATFTFTNAMRGVHASTFYKAHPRQHFVNITLSNGAQADQTMVYFYPNATDGFDPAFDANRLQSSWSIPQLYTRAAGEKLSYNAYEPLQPGESKSVPMGFHSAQPGNLSLTFTEVSSLIGADITVALEDKKLNTFTAVSDSFQYHFTKTIGDDNERFVLHFNKAETTVSGILSPDPRPSSLILFPNPTIGLLNIQIRGDYTPSKVELFDALGRLMKTVSGNNASHLLIDISDLAAGVYHLSLDGTKQHTQRIIKR